MNHISIFRNPTYFWLLLFFCVILFNPVRTIAQQDITVDELYKQARHAAFEEENYQKARKIAYRALDRAPDYHGIRIFVARLYSWQESYDKARKELKYVLEKVPKEPRALSAIIDVEEWSGNINKALDWVNKALNYYPRDEEFLLGKASLLRKKKNFEKAEQVYEKVLAIHPSEDARNALETLYLKQMKHTLSLSYRHDRFTGIFEPWNFLELQMSRQTPYGSVIGRIQYANRFSNDGLQINVDAYPSLSEGLYAYVSGGYSESSIYPRYRFGLSLYKSLPWSMELAGGLRYLDFTSSKVTLYTASLSKYWGSYLFTARTYILPSSEGASQSLNFIARRYFGNAETYFELNGGFGSASTNIQFEEDIRRLDSWSIGLSVQKPLNKRVNIGTSADYEFEQFPSYDRKRYSFRVNISYRF